MTREQQDREVTLDQPAQFQRFLACKGLPDSTGSTGETELLVLQALAETQVLVASMASTALATQVSPVRPGLQAQQEQLDELAWTAA